MLYQVFEFYKKELSMYNLVFKFLKFWSYCLIIFPFICGAVVVLISIVQNEFFTFAFFISMILPFVILFIVVNKKAKQVVKNNYGVSSKEIMWNSYDVLFVIRKYEKDLLLNYLKNIDSSIDEVDVKELSEAASIEAERLKTKFPIIPSFFAALFISLWNNFFSWLYKSENIKDFNFAIQVFTIATLVILMLIGLFIMMLTLYDSLREDIFDKEQKRMKALSQLLKELYDDMQREKRRNKEIVYEETP